MAFQKGQSGNPGGRPAIAKEIKELALTKSEEAFQKIVGLLDDPDPKIVMAAAKEILDRAYGKPIQGHQLNDADGQAITPILNLTLKSK